MHSGSPNEDNILNRWVVIPSYDEPESLRRCLASLDTECRDLRVLIVDHGPRGLGRVSPDRLFQGVEVLRRSPDLWWTGAANEGIEFALDHGADQIMLLNSDCVLTPGSAAELFRSAYETNGVTAPVQRDFVTRKITAARVWTAVTAGFLTFRVERTTRDVGLRRTPMIIGGRGAVLNRSVLEKVGLFAEDDLPHYAADHDLYLRCRRSGIPLFVHTGTSILVDSDTSSTATSVGDLSFSQFISSLKDKRSHRNLEATRAFFRRNYPVRALWWIGYTLAVSRYAVLWSVKRTTAAAIGKSRGLLARVVGSK